MGLNFSFEDDVIDDSLNKTEPPSKDNGKINVGFSDKRSSAYLGPNLWDMGGGSITLEDLMNEDDISDEGVDPRDMFYSAAAGDMEVDGGLQSSASETEDTEHVDIKPTIRPSIIVPPLTRDIVKIEPIITTECSNSALYVESKKAKKEREKEERKQKLEVLLEFDAHDIALATVPGVEFDPKTRTFNQEELRPQPIIKKRKKRIVPEEDKDEKYWEKRLKNKQATRRSREAKRLKENQIVLRAAFLEKENKVLKGELENTYLKKSKLETEIKILNMKIQRHESGKLKFSV